MTNKHNLVVILVAIIISAGIYIIGFPERTKKKPALSAQVFSGLNGWGYDILVNDTLVIHQETIPAIHGKKGFPKKEQAEQTAELIINKMKRGQHPTVTTFELEQIFPLNEVPYDQPKKIK